MSSTILAPRRTIIDAGIRGEGLWYQLALITAGSLLVALLAQIRIPLWFTPVPITGQTAGVLLVGALLGSRRGTLSMGLYLLAGVVGFPFFTGADSGWHVIAGPTGGYIVGFILSAFVVGFLAERGWDRRLTTAVLAMVLGQIVIYAAGLIWLAHLVGADQAIPLGLTPFLAGDALKVAAAAATLPLGWSLLRRTDR